jgi:hypothetical protein
MASGQIMSHVVGMWALRDWAWILGAHVNEQGRVVIGTAIREQMGIEGPTDLDTSAEVVFVR